MTSKEYYYKRKDEIKEEAIDYSNRIGEYEYLQDYELSWGEYADITSYFYELGKRYGLLKEFKENAIC